MSMFTLKCNEEIVDKKIEVHKASFRLELDRCHEKQNLFNKKRAVLFISVGQLYHEGSKFLATIALINKYPFVQCDIVMADTLQRFNHYGRMSEQEARILSKKSGDDWLKRNDSALSIFKIKHKIIRWDELLLHPDYNDLKKCILKEYQINSTYTLALHSNVETYIERLQSLNPGCDVKNLFKFGVEYLIEECPIVMPLWAKMDYDFIIYPKPLTPGMAKTRELFVEPKFNNKCQWVYLRFKKR